VGFLQRIADAYEDPARRARAMLWLWLLSTAFLVIGFLVMLAILVF